MSKQIVENCAIIDVGLLFNDIQKESIKYD